MATSMLLGIFDWISEFFKELFNLIPKVIYLLYASLACVIDVLQLFFRKLAGLDVYYVDGKAVSGDLVTNFIAGILGINVNATDGVTFEYSALTTVFWSFIVFGIIIAFMSTIVAIVKSHYSYDDKSAKGPMQYVYTAGKAIINMVAVPIIVVLGLYVSQGILTALDTMTSTSSGSVVSMYGSDKLGLIQSVDTVKSATGLSKNKTYIYYDIFGFGGAISYGSNPNMLTAKAKDLALIGAQNQTFSGSLFKVSAYNANRARIGQYKISSNILGTASNEYTLFGNAETDDELANMIDTAFACNLHMDDWHWANNWGAISSDKYFTNFLIKGGSAFSKFNVGLVWYYYDLWQFNFIVGFAGCIVCATLFVNIIMGLIARLFMCIGLFLVAPPLFGLAPLDGGNAGKSWRQNFMKQALMAYGAVVGMNIFFLILPYMNEIDFFNIAIADYFAQTLVIIVGLITVKAFISVLSGLIGAEDANKSGEGIAEEVGTVAGKATKMTVGAAKLGAKATGMIAKGGFKIADKASGGKLGQKTERLAGNISNKFSSIKNKLAGRGDQQDLQDFDTKDKLLDSLKTMKGSDFDEDAFRIKAQEAGLKGSELDNLVSTASDRARAAGSRAMGIEEMRKDLMTRDSRYNKVARSGLINATTGRKEAGFDRKFGNAMLKAKDKAQKRAKVNAEIGQLGQLALAPFSNIDSVMGDSKFYSAFKDKSGIAPKPDWTKQTAQNVEALTKEVQGGRGDVRGGFETLNTGMGRGFKNTNRRQDRMRRDMNAGFADTGAKLNAANATLSGIEADTEATKKATQRIARETDGLKARQKKVIAQNREAHADLKKAQDKLDVIVKDPQNTRKPKI